MNSLSVAASAVTCLVLLAIVVIGFLIGLEEQSYSAAAIIASALAFGCLCLPSQDPGPSRRA
jgi:hypothetical protein